MWVVAAWTPKDELPDCTIHGSEGVAISKDGTYGKRARQWFRCTNEDTGVFHRFTPRLGNSGTHTAKRRGRGEIPRVVECLTKDRGPLLGFYDFPAEHWLHIRTTNPIRSTFAMLRHRTKRVKGAFSVDSALSMMLQLALEAEKGWHRITAVEKLGQLIQGVRFVDGIAQLAACSCPYSTTTRPLALFVTSTSDAHVLESPLALRSPLTLTHEVKPTTKFADSSLQGVKHKIPA
jgi:hypothetical protein